LRKQKGPVERAGRCDADGGGAADHTGAVAAVRNDNTRGVVVMSEMGRDPGRIF